MYQNPKTLFISIFNQISITVFWTYCMQKCTDVANDVYEVHTKKRDRECETTGWRTTETHHMMDSHSFVRQVLLLNDCFVSERCLEHQIWGGETEGKTSSSGSEHSFL